MLQVCLVFLGNTLTIQICLYVVFLDFMFFHVRIILHRLGIPLPHKDSFSKVKNFYIKKAYYSICGDFGVNADEIWMNGDWFYTTEFRVFNDGGRAIERSPTDNLT